MIKNSQHGFAKNDSFPTNFISFSGSVTGVIAKGKATDVMHPDLGKAFDAILHKILTKTLGKYGLNAITMKWVYNCSKNCT